MPRPWERRASEPDAHWLAFVKYREMGTVLGATPGKRMMSKLAKEPGTPSSKTLTKWARQWEWKARAHAYDRYLDRAALDTTERTLRQMKKRHVKLAMRLQTLATLELEKMVTQAEKAGRMPDFKSSEVTKALVEGVKLERLSRGESTEHIEGKLDLKKLSLAELKTLKSLTSKAKAQDS